MIQLIYNTSLIEEIFGSLLVLYVCIIAFSPIFLIIYLIWLSINKKSKYKKKENEFINLIQQSDPNFDITSFKENVKKTIYLLNECFTNQDVEKLMVLESSSMYEIHKKNIETALEKDIQIVYDCTDVGDVKLTKYKVEGTKEVLGCCVWVTYIKLTIRPSTKQVSTRAKTTTTSPLYLEFIRSTNVKTEKGKDFATQCCPNCGAVIEVNAQGKCIYCNSLILNGEHSWVLNEATEFDIMYL